MPQIISFHCISRHFALGSKATSASSQGIVPVGRFRSGQSSERLNRGLPLQNDLDDQMIHHEQYKVLWNQYQLPNSDVKNGKVNTVFGFSSTISKFIMFPPRTLTDHSNIDVKNVVNYSHLNLIHFNNKAIYEIEIDSWHQESAGHSVRSSRLRLGFQVPIRPHSAWFCMKITKLDGRSRKH